METNTTPTVLDTITTTDQNTGQQITWTVEHSSPVGVNTGREGWTHCLVCKRPKGRKFYIIHVGLIGDVAVKVSRPVVAY